MRVREVILECGGKRSATALLHPQRAVSPVGCHRTPEHSAFTLIELLVALALLAILGSSLAAAEAYEDEKRSNLRDDTASLAGAIAQAKRQSSFLGDGELRQILSQAQGQIHGTLLELHSRPDR